MNFRLKKGQKLFFDYFIYRAGTDYKFIQLERLKSQSQRSREVLAKNKKEKKMQWGKKKKMLWDCSEILVRGEGWYFSGKVPVKNA